MGFAPRVDFPKEEIIKALDACKGNFTRAGQMLSIHRDTVRKLCIRHGIDVEKFRDRRPPVQEIKEQVKERCDSLVDLERARLAEENKELFLRVRKLLEERNELLRIREDAFGLIGDGLKVPRWALRIAEKKAGRGRETPILFTSDLQYGERVDSAAVDGWNSYDTEVAKERYRRYIETVVRLWKYHTAHPSFHGCYLLRGGDTINGAIHDDLVDTDCGAPPMMAREVAELEAWGIERLLEHFERVHVISVPGNHGRTTKKPRAKRYSDHSLDDLVTWAIEWHFAGKFGDMAQDKRPVTFYTPRSGDAQFDLGNQRYLLTHGDRGPKGGTGFIGPVALLAKFAYKLRQQWAAMQVRLDHVFMGHFHVGHVLPHLVSNGALVGFNEYAGKNLRVEPEPAMQWLLTHHPEHGLIDYRPVVVQ